jgi:hypothetical protein
MATSELNSLSRKVQELESQLQTSKGGGGSQYLGNSHQNPPQSRAIQQDNRVAEPQMSYSPTMMPPRENLKTSSQRRYAEELKAQVCSLF